MNEPRVMPSAENLIKIVEAKEAGYQSVSQITEATGLPRGTVQRGVAAGQWLSAYHKVVQLPPRWQGLIAECEAILRDRRVGAGLARREG